MSFSLRNAQLADCRDIAALYQIAAEGIADYVWSKLAEPGDSIIETGIKRFQRENTAFSYENCTIAEDQGKILGMLSAFPMLVDPQAEDEEETDPILMPYSKLEEDQSFYISGICCYEPYRGQGIGEALMLEAEAKARAHGLDKLSLIVFEENTHALRFYNRLGYQEVMREKVVPHALIHCKGDALLVLKHI